MAAKIKNIAGQRFNRWTAIRFAERRGRLTYWKCRCKCGTIGFVTLYNLRSGGSKSCGCLRDELARNAHLTHGMYGTPTYISWCLMLARCRGSNQHYGGRGIRVCARWRKSFTAFFADMGIRPSKRHSIDRFPNMNGDYKPDNCRWATTKQQSRNRRNNRLVTAFGQTKPLVQWTEEFGLPYQLTYSRIVTLKWPPERVFVSPL